MCNAYFQCFAKFTQTPDRVEYLLDLVTPGGNTITNILHDQDVIPNGSTVKMPYVSFIFEQYYEHTYFGDLLKDDGTIDETAVSFAKFQVSCVGKAKEGKPALIRYNSLPLPPLEKAIIYINQTERKIKRIARQSQIGLNGPDDFVDFLLSQDEYLINEVLYALWLSDEYDNALSLPEKTVKTLKSLEVRQQALITKLDNSITNR